MKDKNPSFYIKFISTDSVKTKMSFTVSKNSYAYIIGASGATSKCCALYFKRDTSEALIANFGDYDLTATCNANGNVVITAETFFAGIMFITENVNLVAI